MSRFFFLTAVSILCFTSQVNAISESGYGPSNGIALEFSVGSPNTLITTSGLEAKYSGLALQGGLLFPLMEVDQFHMDLDISYVFTSLENNASTTAETEWARTNGLGIGFRAQVSYFFIGLEYQTMKGKHVKAGTANEIFEYDYNPLRYHAGATIPLSPITSLSIAYSQNLPINFDVQGTNIEINEQIIWLRIQIDLGVNFLNLLDMEQSFNSTRSQFLLY